MHYETAAHVLCDASTPGAIPFVEGGLQPNGLYLQKIDLDKHNADQDPDALLAYIKRRLGPDLVARLVIRPTKRGGYHIPFYYHRPLMECKIYDPRNGVYAGELCTQRIELIAHQTIPTLTALEFSTLQSSLHMIGAVSHDETSISATIAPATNRKDRISEGMSLIAGWNHIRDWRERLDALCAVKPMLAQFRTRTRTYHDRSAAYGAFVQSLMLHAGPLGRDVGERCAMVAAMAIGIGAGGKEDEKNYRIEKDTAALIAKILHGDPMEMKADGTIPHWTVPKWYSGEVLPAPVAAPEPIKQTDHATKRRDLRLAALRRKLQATEPDELGRRRFLIERISTMPRRTTQADLKWLRDHGEIVTGQIDGNGAPYAILTSQFGGAKPCKKPDKAPQTQADLWGASDNAEYRAPMPQTDDKDAQSNKVERTPKADAPIDDQAIRDAIAAHYAREFAKPRGAEQDAFTPRRRSEVKARFRSRALGPLPRPSPYQAPPPRVELDEVDLPTFGPAPAAVGAQPFGVPKPPAPVVPLAPIVVPPVEPLAALVADPSGIVARLKARIDLIKQSATGATIG